MDSPISRQKKVTETFQEVAGLRGDLVELGDALVEYSPGMFLSQSSTERGDHVLQRQRLGQWQCRSTTLHLPLTLNLLNLLGT